MTTRTWVDQTETFTIYSNQVKDTYKISVFNPPAKEKDKLRPILFLLDENIFFNCFLSETPTLWSGD